MKLDNDDLRQRFERLSDDELLRRIESRTLLPEADEIARAEAFDRGLNAVPANIPSQSEPDPSSDERVDDIDLTTLFQTNDVLKATVLKSLLESEGLFAYVWGMNLGVTNIIWSIAAGGVRVQVRNDQVDQARNILAAFERGEYQIDE